MFDTPLPTAHDTLSDNLVGTDPTNIIPERKRSRRRFVKTKTLRIPRPPNAFILYRNSKQKEVKANYEDLTNSQVSKIVSMLWWKEPEEVKLKWEKMADREKLRHIEENPDYVYERKRKSDTGKTNGKRKQTCTTAIKTTNDGNTHVKKDALTVSPSAKRRSRNNKSRSNNNNNNSNSNNNDAEQVDPQLVAIADTMFAASHNPSPNKQNNQHVNTETHSVSLSSFVPDTMPSSSTISNSLLTPPIVPSSPPTSLLPQTLMSVTFPPYTYSPMSPFFLSSAYSPIPMSAYQASLQQEPSQSFFNTVSTASPAGAFYVNANSFYEHISATVADNVNGIMNYNNFEGLYN